MLTSFLALCTFSLYFILRLLDINVKNYFAYVRFKLVVNNNMLKCRRLFIFVKMFI